MTFQRRTITSSPPPDDEVRSDVLLRFARELHASPEADRLHTTLSRALPSLLGYPDVWVIARVGLGTALLRNGLIVRGMSIAMAKTRDPDLRRFIHDQHDTYFSDFADRDVLRDAFVASVSHDVRAFAPDIDVPVLLVAAQQDDITPIEAERHLATLFSDAELVEIADVGHLIHYETPAEAAGAVRRFLRVPVARDR